MRPSIACVNGFRRSGPGCALRSGCDRLVTCLSDILVVATPQANLGSGAPPEGRRMILMPPPALSAASARAPRPAEAADRPGPETWHAVAVPWSRSVGAGRAGCPRPARRFPATARDRIASTRAGPSDSEAPRPRSASGAAISAVHRRRSGVLATPAWRDPPSCPMSSADRRGRARACSSSLSITIRVVSITPSPHRL